MAVAADVRRDEVEGAVVVAERGCEDAARGVDVLERKLGIAGERVTDGVPVDEVLASIERDPGEILERTGREVEGAVDLANSGVGMESRQYRVLVTHGYLFTKNDVYSVGLLDRRS